MLFRSTNSFYLSLNPNAIDILKENKNKIHKIIYTNPGIFQLDYEEMKINFQDFEEDLIKEILKPTRVIRNLILFNYDIDDMYLF